MVASQIAVTDAAIESLTPFGQWAFYCAKHSHPKVRYASLQVIGQYSEDLFP